MTRLLPSIIASIVASAFIYFTNKPTSSSDPGFLFLLVSIGLFLVLNILILTLLKNSTDTNSIAYILGFTGLSMMLFLGLVFSYEVFTETKPTMKSALSLFISYVLMKIGLLYPLLKK